MYFVILMKRIPVCTYCLRIPFKHPADNGAGTADVGWETNLSAGITCIYDIFLIEYVLAKGSNLVVNLAWLETVTGCEVEQSVGILGKLWLVALFEEHLRFP